MRVLIVAGSLVAEGQGRFAHGLATALAADTANQITVIGPGSARMLALPNTVRLVTIHDLYGLSLSSVAGFIRYLFLVRKLSRQSDLVHFATDFPNYLFATWLIGKPYCITSHGTYSVAGLTRGVRRVCIRRIFRKAGAIHAVSAYTARRVADSVEGVKRMRIIHQGITLHAAGAHVSNTLEMPKKFLLSMGAVKPRKGLHISIEAFARIAKKFPDLSYLIAGSLPEGGYADELSMLVNQYGLADRIRFLGHVTDEDREVLFQRCELYLQPSITETTAFEGYGIVFLEAGSFSKPVISTFGSGIEDAVLHEKTGFLVPQNNVVETASALERLLGDPDLRKRMGQANYEHARAQSWDRVLREFVKLYEEVIQT